MALVLPQFYRDDDELARLHANLKLIPCPSCKAVQTLILHGFLMGYSEKDEASKARRGRRIFCNNRKARHVGCGRTFGVFAAETLRRIRLVGAASLWAFFSLVLQLGNTAGALRQSALDFSLTSAYRLLHRFIRNGDTLRTGLAFQCPPPAAPKSALPEAFTAAHLTAAFPADASPVAAYQHRIQRSFLERL